MFIQILFLICSVCNTYGVASAASTSCASDEYRVGQFCCLSCPGGYRVHRDCTATANTLCSKCPDGHFKEGLSGQKQCSACTRCVTGQKVKKCTPTSDAECEIPDGFFCSISEDKGAFSEATLSCQPHTICDSVGGVQIQPGTDSTDSTCITYVAIVFIIIGCISFMISLVLGALFYRWLKMERELTELEKQINEMETPEQEGVCYTLWERLYKKKKTPKQKRTIVELNDLYWEKREPLEVDWTLTELDILIHEMETPDQVEACYTLWERLEAKEQTPEQKRTFDELMDRFNEKREPLEVDWTLTELDILIREMETPDQVEACYTLWERLDKKEPTPEQKRKFDELFDRHIKKMKTMDLVWEFNEGEYRRSLKETRKWNKTLSAWIDQILKKEEMINTDNNHELADKIREMKRVKDEQDREFYKLIDQLLEERKEQEGECYDGADGKNTSCYASTTLHSNFSSTSHLSDRSYGSDPFPRVPAPSSETQPAEETTPLMSSESPESTRDQQEHT